MFHRQPTLGQVSLLQEWQLLQRWIAEDREFLLWRQRLGTLARIWEENGRGEGALLRDALLQEAHVRSAERLDELSTLERAYLEESEAVAQQAEAERVTVRQREREQAQRLRQLSRLLAVALFVAALAGMGVSNFHLPSTASSYGLPALRSDAASALISNQGWSSSDWMNLCPTIPVAPKIPTFIFSIIYSPTNSIVILNGTQIFTDTC